MYRIVVRRCSADRHLHFFVFLGLRHMKDSNPVAISAATLLSVLLMAQIGIGQSNRRDDHACRLVGDSGCEDTGNQRCAALFDPPDGSPGSCQTFECYSCPGTNGANSTLCVYSEGQYCAMTERDQYNHRCGGPDQHRNVGICGDEDTWEGGGVDDECDCLFQRERMNTECNNLMMHCFLHM